ncbi:GFA family protein [Neiella marina]|uniref:GFA family protein n=1 Tax=Neiella holothuriorum TaxID=2870530 RepID=A0ABS7ECQ8_9GAMM|nr:GFA family protein [Neiella holothuriorum]MBW8190122.1 GFA family protein [Neiella holothuriorum]
MKTYSGRCHCGAITFSFESEPIAIGLRCNCSMCRRKSAVMSTFALSPEQLRIVVKNDALADYQFGNQVAHHHFCRVCGIYPFHQTMRQPGHYRVNLACIDDIEPLSLPTEQFDGASL